ncbi:sigma 54-interacting transcriptional regulator [Amphiplicatus metriothermophilus]|uniref:Psp operon transcriptional activator n=1 Tax=Amphiplicatus metriothermophilus TaxID=1519374 RepID=A0A239Q0S7_9PROT|nr:sigma 54-interacting transcriptional regulator [Amphiplicatus metriothermophilus]MBB5520023.1 psp operon transcriptional activator [Amphiplicatus metriothermophilus]SNT76030.1 psp operon transcriptional activator [Amphiplicatus metriothermophilus]
MKLRPEPPELIGQAPAFLDALAHASAAAGLDRPLLIVGERGAGKELLAARIHFLSPRWDGPFLKVNCAALSDELLDSELFGHEAGAFTGARARHLGRFERAEGGTLFLDEIASASLRVQEKLLRVIEYGEFERVGGEETLIANVRVLAASNIDLRAQAEAGRFRPDLLDRLAFDVVLAPPLRARKEDVPLLAAHFAGALASEIGAAYEGFTAEAMAAFIAHDWPGNVRELKNAAERSFYRWIAAGNAGPVGEAAIDPFAGAALPPDLASAAARAAPPRPASPPASEPPAPPGPGPYDLRKRLDEAERKWTEEALAAHGGNQRLAATHLGLTYDQMRGLVRKHGLARPRARTRAGRP